MKTLLPIIALAASLSACGGSDDNTPMALPAATQAAVDSTVQQQMSADNIADSLDDSFLQEFYADPSVSPTSLQFIERSAARAAEFVADGEAPCIAPMFG